MFLLTTRVGPSAIHGVGVFACQDAAVGQVLWRYEPAFDRLIDEDELRSVPEAFRAFVEAYAYPSGDLGGRLVLPCDHAKFLNHSDDPNTQERPFESIACKPIAAGDEITCDYRAFVVGWTGFD